ncbi:hypothetical protein A1O1_06170 [Capronia coronata CBS 617.96]|uniref:SAM domain-containing protein n=1 Tax=Capronia coronata CBS 617.96 TaxID=1182541 RepID=W9Y976_9EURO|nr:uncharacterized protein A1O1_06170 [Capronia coronata CBS 617.96]EXJ85801.1 hypothetical protein A1O1_06170 [Capronia coronata CBS 617.96]
MSFTVQQRPGGALQPGDILVVIHDFDARSSDELTLRKSDQVELVELDEGFGDGWYLGRHLGQGTVGLFPGGKMLHDSKTITYCLTMSDLPLVYTAKLPSNFTPVGPANSRPSQLAHKLSNGAKTEPSEPTIPEDQSTARRSLVPKSPMQPSSMSFSPVIPRSIGQALSGTANGEDSPVMNETLSVIDEHITDLSTPRQSLAPLRFVSEDSESEYSSHLDRASYVAGPETESEESLRLTEADVKQWDAKDTAEFLRALGVDSKHCDIFEEQEITGDVLLDMDQSFIHMKEYDFGLMGRRLKTWHKIREFQTQIRNSPDSGKSSLKQDSSNEDVARIHSRALSGATILPRIPSLMEERGLSIRQSQHAHPYVQTGSASPPPEPQVPPSPFARSPLGGSTPPSPWRASVAAESPRRPSAASIREMNHSRRHSSIDFAKQGYQETAFGTFSTVSPPHKKNVSLDRDWSMSNATTAGAGASTPSLRADVAKNVSAPPDSPFDGDHSTVDIDRGYFSGNEVDNRKSRNLLKKKGGGDTGHSRQSSMIEETHRPGLGVKRHSRLSSVDSVRDRGLGTGSSAAQAYHSSSSNGRFRSASARNLGTQRSPTTLSPTVTNLEDDNLSALSSPKMASGSPSPAGAPMPWAASQKARKLFGLRAASDAITGTEKQAANASNITTGPLKESPIASPSGSQTPSATSQSFEIENTDASSKGTADQLGPLLHTKTTVRTNPKTKRQTSAYTKGLLPISPAEARKHCDHCGWMKKKSTGLMTQWKPRLFILRGRRLSYYYSETDTEEKGIIDISGHKVLSISTDPITALHATIAGGTSPSMASGSATDKSKGAPRHSGGTGPFFFKLVPPKAGSSRAVQFTKPTVHVFQVDNIAEGRKWMGEILKATIEHDLSSFETTNRQKTISLAKARARKERPPALKETADIAELAENPTPAEEKGLRESGLNIQGLGLNQSNIDLRLDVDFSEIKAGLGEDAVQKTET